MPEDPENHTIHMLREMREENRKFREEVHSRFDTIETSVTEGFTTVNERLDRLESVFAGLSFLHADERGEIEALKTRMERLESKLGLSEEPAE